MAELNALVELKALVKIKVLAELNALAELKACPHVQLRHLRDSLTHKPMMW